ncbi:CocE/NonD family hydrolase [Lentibacter algarum]|uniref:CocE/NonD family hydrolase n=1 Tax=Lentibacter algarum TaxID=576131 RepID=UPI001C080405|nr:CocE/NonD family hydrolase [Lentibacter algarum]MBU2983238.1 CocE/NonD family hydrolase [Lentibacter algarum]
MSINTRDITEIEDMGIVMPDGCRLSARVWMPVDAGDDPVPAVLEHLPYRKRDGTTARDELSHPWMAARGYAMVRVDMRGNGDSEGLMTDEYTQQELDDAVSVIEWLAAQPWCTGNVGMQGISWGGFNSLQVAAMQPAPLKAVITLCSTVDRYADDIHYKGGCLLNENFGWGSTMWAYSSRPPDPALRPDDWREIWLERLENEPFLAAEWLQHQTRDDYWKHGSVCEDYSKITAKVLAVGGWGDAYKNTVPALVENVGAKGIVGPWVHKYPHFAVPEPRIGFLQEAQRWWDKWLKGIETGVEDDADYRAYVMEGLRPKAWYDERPGRWTARRGPATDVARMKLGAGGKLGSGGAFEAVVASPAHCGAAAGEYCAIWLGPEMPSEQRVDDAFSAVFTGEVQREDIEIIGAPEVTLTLAADKPLGQVCVRLNHIHPDGASARITYGVLNLTHRNSHERPEEMPVGEAVVITVKLDHIAYKLPRGHRLAVAVSSAYWPLLWPSPEACALTLTGGELALPVSPVGEGDECGFEPAVSAPEWQVEVIREAKNSRESRLDMVTGEVSLHINDDFGKRRDSVHGLVSGGCAREIWAIHPDDPLCARGETHWTEELEREGLALRTETYAKMHADAENFYLTGRLEAYENDKKIYTRDVTEKRPRHML